MNLQEALADAQRRVREVNEANGWFDADRTFGDDIALLHSEVSEALEEFRDHGVHAYIMGDDDDGTIIPIRVDHPAEYEHSKPLGVPSEAADILVRLLDFCERYDIDLGAEFEAKLAYNATRGHRHGGKTL
jgi:hypothetical protein